MSVNIKQDRKIHVCQFVEYTPYGVHKLSKYNEFSGSRYAMSRSDGSLEVWKYILSQNYWKNEFKIPGKLDYSIESLLWTKAGVLITGDTHGDILEWDFNNIYSQKIVETNNGSVYAMDFCPKNDSIIVASGQGNVLLYNSSPLSFVKIICVTSSKITAIAWHSSGESFVLSTQNSTIFLYNFSNSILTTLINPHKLKHNRSIAWCLLFLTDWTVVIGDTTGSVQFWDAYTSTQIQCFKCHKADTLAICANKNENIIISTSVDRTICYFSKDINHQWTFNPVHGHHYNDIMAIAGNNTRDEVVTGGIDGFFCHFSLQSNSITKICNFGIFNQRDFIKISTNGFFLMYIESRVLNFWQVNCDNDSAPKLVLQIRNNHSTNIQSASISDCGHYISYSTLETSFLYNLKKTGEFENLISIKKFKIDNFSIPYITAEFSKNSLHLYVLTFNYEFVAIDLIEKCVIFSVKIPFEKSKTSGPSDIVVSETGSVVVINRSFPAHAYFIDIDKQTVFHLCQLSQIVTCYTIVSNLNKLFIMCANGSLFVYDLVDLYDVSEFEPKIIHLREGSNFMGMFYDHFHNSLIMYSLEGLAKIDLNIMFSCLRSKTKPTKINVTCLTNYRPLIYSGIFADGSIVAVTRKFKDIYTSIQPPLYIKKYNQT